MNLSPNPKKTLLFTLAFLWGAAVIVGYFYMHKPVSADLLLAVLAVLGDLLIGLGIVSLAGGIGRKIVHFEGLLPLEQAAVHAVGGALILAGSFFVLGIAHLYLRWLIWLLFLAALVLTRKQILAWWRDLVSIGEGWQIGGKFTKTLMIVALTFGLIQLMFALAPPIKWDALAYHLDLPRRYIAAGYLVFNTANPFSGHPQAAEMLNTLAMTLFRSQTAAVMIWGFGVLFFIGIIDFSKRFTAKVMPQHKAFEAAWVIVISLLAAYSVRYLLGWSYSDLLAALFGLAALILFFTWMDTGIPSVFRCMIVIIAGAIIIKWTEGVLLLGILLCLPFIRKKHPVSWKLLLESAGIAVLIVSPWMIRDFIVTGNPFFPFFLASPGYDGVRIAGANNFSQQIDIWSRIFLPISITISGVDTAPGFSFDPGPLLLMLGIPGVVYAWSNRRIRLLVLITIPAAIAIGLLSIRYGHLLQPRLYLAVLAAVAIPVGLGWFALQELTTANIRLRRIFQALIILFLAFSLIQDFVYIFTLNPFGALISQRQAQLYLRNGTGAYVDAVDAVDALPADAKVLTLWEPRGLYLPISAQADLWIDRFETDLRAQGSAQAMIQSWCTEGYTHLLVFRRGELYIDPQSGRPSQLWSAYLEMQSLLTDHQDIVSEYDLFKIPCK